MAFQRQGILRQFWQQRGSVGSAGEGNRARGFERADADGCYPCWYSDGTAR